MKTLKSILVLVLLIFSLQACKNSSSLAKKDSIAYVCPMKCEGTKTYEKPGKCPVCGMKLVPEKSITKNVLSDGISDESIFNLTSVWHTQNNKSIQLKDLKGKTLVMVMIYTTCKAACPRLVADVRNIAAKIPKKYTDKIDYVFVSIDPKTDTPARLKSYAKENYMEDKQWIFLQGTEESVREFANVLSVKYKEISPLNFSHSNIISVFNPQGELVHQQEGLGVDNAQTIKAILALASR